VEGLEHEAEAAPPQAREGVLVERGEVDAVQNDAPAIDAFEARDAVEQGRLPDPRLAHDGDALARREAQRNAGEERRLSGRAETLGQSIDLQHGGSPCKLSIHSATVMVPKSKKPVSALAGTGLLLLPALAGFIYAPASC
jgi:hypothetical protein